MSNAYRGQPSPNYGNSTKQTFVQTETSDHMPDFYPNSSAPSTEYDAQGRRIKKKYTTTTVTTVTTTTILLPNMQDALVYEPVTQHFAESQQHSGRNNAAPPALTNGSAPAQIEYGYDSNSGQLTATTHQPWTFKQENTGYVQEGQPQARAPTLQELGISSYFDRDSRNGSNVRGAISNNDYVRRTSNGQPQPWIVGESRAEVEGGVGVYAP